jgi:methylphosphotriester-DNA--protein-cysteine methyltransferase
VRDRVFFADEATAVAAGYRPCAVCMPAAYAEWKLAPDVSSTSLAPDVSSTSSETSHRPPRRR